MKKIFSVLLLSVSIVFFSSFFTISSGSTSNYSIGMSKFKHYTVHVHSTWLSQGCTFTLTMTVEYDWNGPGTAPTNMTFSDASITINCKVKPPTHPQVNNSRFDNETGYFTEISFNPTGDEDFDGVLQDPNFIAQVLNDINTEIDKQ